MTIIPKSGVFLFICSVIFIVKAQKRCPSQEAILPCRCHLKGDDYQIWCSHSDLTQVLGGIRSIAEIITDPIDEFILENNYLPSLSGRTFTPLKIIRLMLRHNGLERVSSDFLGGLKDSLVELFVVEPQLRSLPEDSLVHLNNLQAITIQTNLMKRLPLITNLPNLRYVQIESLSLLELTPRNFKDLPSLEKLHLANSPRLTRLEGNLLLDLPNLHVVNISYCGINWVHPRAFMGLPNLRQLSLVGNKIVDAGMIGRATKDLPLLEVLMLDNNYIDKISEADFVDIPKLKKLYLSSNQIQELQYGGFHRVPNLRVLDLNNNDIKRVHPESFLQQSGSGLEELWLVNNEINHVMELRSLLDALPRLLFLDLSFNKLESIPFGSLRGHPTIERLHLDFNKIHHIEREAFMAMPALRELRLKNNSLSEVLDGPLWNLPALKGLDLSSNFFRRLEPRFFANLPNLRRIDFSQNQLTIVDPSSFIMTPEVEHVNLSQNLLATLHPATFRHLLKLYELDVSHNNLVEFVPGLPRGVEYLYMSHNVINSIPAAPSPDLDLPTLRLLDLSANNIQIIPRDSLKFLPQLRRLYLRRNSFHRIDNQSFEGLSRLEILNLESNRIATIMPDSLKEMTELRELNLRNNRIDILYADILKSLPHLRRLDISRNQLAEILPSTIENNKELRTFDASFNTLIQFPPIIGMEKLEIVDLTNNRIKDLPQLSSLTSLKELNLARNFVQELKTGLFDNLLHLKNLNLDNNYLEIVEPNAIRALPSLKIVKLGWNKLKNLVDTALNNLQHLEVVELQHNQINQIFPHAFNSVPKLLMLNLSSNHLANLEDIGAQNLRSLEVLDMSGNKISRITDNSLVNLEMLVELKMDDNAVCGIHGNPFNSMPRLRVLSMRNNRIMTIPEKSIHKILGNVAVLDLDGNPLVCNCNLLWLQSWLQEVNTMGPKCVDGSLLREMRLQRQDCLVDDKNADLVAPGCEAELLSAPGTFPTSQVFSNKWMKLRTSNLSTTIIKGHKTNNLAPLPEESEYFYDEYVDYPFNNETLNDATLIGANNKAEPTTSKPTKSPHRVPGDTPTIYAASKQNKTKPDIPNKVVNSPSTSGFTFFGVPLSGINFNNLLGGRSNKKTPEAERKIAIVNSPPRNGSRQNNLSSFPPLSTVMHPPPIGGLPSYPSVEVGGFRPILPGSGGFKPIPNPVEAPTTSIPQTTTILPPTTTSKIEIEKIDPVVIDVTEKVTTSTNSNVEELETAANSQNVEDVVNKTRPSLSTTPVADVIVEPTAQVTRPTAIPSMEETVEKRGVAKIGPPTNEEVYKKGGTPLAALLVPGGQQPEFRGGRPTITKVQSPYSSSAPLLSSSMDLGPVNDPLPHREGKTTKEQAKNDDMDWYFANYNNSNNLPASIGGTNSAGGCKCALKWVITLIIVKLYI